MTMKNSSLVQITLNMDHVNKHRIRRDMHIYKSNFFTDDYDIVLKLVEESAKQPSLIQPILTIDVYLRQYPTPRMLCGQ